jgi:spore maturation protein SpmA
VLNYIWLGLILLGVLIGGFTGKMPQVAEGAINGAKTAVEIIIGLIGIMTLWLGAMRLAEKSGLVQVIARALRPVLKWLFPEVPPEHPAMGSMVLNIAANMLGLANAATPLGLRAMKHLEKLNPHPGTATNAMCMFLTINTSSVQLLPMTAIAVLVSAGSRNPFIIVGTAFAATCVSTAVGITLAKLFEKFRLFPVPVSGTAASRDTTVKSETEPEEEPLTDDSKVAPVPGWGKALLWAFFACFVLFFLLAAFPERFPSFGLNPTEDQLKQQPWIRAIHGISIIAIPFLLSFFPIYAALRKVKVYEEFVEGAKEGFGVAIKIVPFLVTILLAIGMFRGAGGIDRLTEYLRPALDFVKFPPELVPISLMRPLSGSGSFGLFTDLVKQFGPDHIISRMAATLFGATETTFYVITVYFGSVAIRRTRYAIASGLLADLAGIIAAIIVCRMVFAS